MILQKMHTQEIELSSTLAKITKITLAFFVAESLFKLLLVLEVVRIVKFGTTEVSVTLVI